MATGTRQDPYLGFNFRVVIDSITSAAFKDASGLDSSTTAVPYREGTDPTNITRQIPGLSAHGNITLSRGIATSKELWAWKENLLKGVADWRSLSIELWDAANKEKKMQWDFREVWPTKWTGPAFDASSDSIAIESLELVHEGIEVKEWK
ncbi:MAG: phage tail protein [Minicystis sp.]